MKSDFDKKKFQSKRKASSHGAHVYYIHIYTMPAGWNHEMGVLLTPSQQVREDFLQQPDKKCSKYNLICYACVICFYKLYIHVYLKLMWAMDTTVIRIKIDLFVCYCLCARPTCFSHRHRTSTYFTQLLFRSCSFLLVLRCQVACSFDSPFSRTHHYLTVGSWLEHAGSVVVNIGSCHRNTMMLEM